MYHVEQDVYGRYVVIKTTSFTRQEASLEAGAVEAIVRTYVESNRQKVQGMIDTIGRE